MSINGLTIVYSDGIKTADYAPPRTVSLTANADASGVSDVEAMIAGVLAMLKRQTHAALHGTQVSQAPAPAGPQSEPEAEPPKRTRRTKAQIAEDEAAASTGSDGGGSTSGDEFPAEPEPATAAATAGDEWSNPPVAVDDAALTKAVTEKNGQLQSQGMSAEAAPVLIRELIASYNPDPTKSFALREIPADRRGDFLAKLAAIKPKAA